MRAAHWLTSDATTGRYSSGFLLLETKLASMPKLKSLMFSTLFAFALFLVGESVAKPKPPLYTDLTASFSQFVDETAGMDKAARVALFHTEMDPLIPGFYTPRFGRTQSQYDASIAHELETFGELRERYEKVQRDFPAAFDAGIQHFRKVFPGFTPNVPVYLLHSIGEMDGGTRQLNGRIHLIFGADVIARIHEPRDLTAFLDHELFHVENGRYFADCEQVWCLLWAEGLATYAAKVMNPGADDQQLLLTSPKPIRADVDANWFAALCYTRSRLFSAESADLESLFVGGAGGKQFPERFGYYVGLRVIEELGGKYSLVKLARMPSAKAKSVLVQGIDGLVAKSGGCRQPT